MCLTPTVTTSNLLYLLIYCRWSQLTFMDALFRRLGLVTASSHLIGVRLCQSTKAYFKPTHQPLTRDRTYCPKSFQFPFLSFIFTSKIKLVLKKKYRSWLITPYPRIRNLYFLPVPVWAFPVSQRPDWHRARCHIPRQSSSLWRGFYGYFQSRRPDI